MPRCVPIATGLASQQGLAHLVPIIAILVGVTAVEAFEGIGRASDGLSTSSFLTKGEQGQYPHGEGVGSNGNIAEHQQSHQAYDQSPRQPARSQQAPPQQYPSRGSPGSAQSQGGAAEAGEAASSLVHRTIRSAEAEPPRARTDVSTEISKGHKHDSFIWKIKSPPGSHTWRPHAPPAFTLAPLPAPVTKAEASARHASTRLALHPRWTLAPLPAHVVKKYLVDNTGKGHELGEHEPKTSPAPQPAHVSLRKTTKTAKHTMRKRPKLRQPGNRRGKQHSERQSSETQKGSGAASVMPSSLALAFSLVVAGVLVYAGFSMWRASRRSIQPQPDQDKVVFSSSRPNSEVFDDFLRANPLRETSGTLHGAL